jgi:hypothetical protein
MKLQATCSMPKLRLRFDSERTAVQLGEEMQRHWGKQFSSGRQPGGEPLPLNKEGKPLGVGNGYLIRSWRVRVVNRRRGQTTVAVLPADRGRRWIAIKAMQKRGVRFQGLDGESREKWETAVRRIAKIMMASALANARKR